MHLRQTATHLLLCAMLAACAGPAQHLNDAQALRAALPATASLVLLGEQHDAPDHQHAAEALVRTLSEQGELHVLLIEMAETGRSTVGLPKDASADEVRLALAWNADAWPWDVYGPLVLGAVRLGVPVWGANLPRNAMRAAMQDATLDTVLPAAAWQNQLERVRNGHCQMLPESQTVPMARIQLARDRAMAQALLNSRVGAAPRQRSLLVSGALHAERSAGIPHHLPPGIAFSVLLRAGAQGAEAKGEAKGDGLAFDRVWPTPAVPTKDYCASLKNLPVAKPPG